jgi:hypothetical protein
MTGTFARLRTVIRICAVTRIRAGRGPRGRQIEWPIALAWRTLFPMGVLDMIASRVAAGSTVDFRPSGSSMVPLIRSRQLVTVAPVDPTTVEIGDIVLARVAGTVASLVETAPR